METKRKCKVVMLATTNDKQPILFKSEYGLSLDFKRVASTMYHLYIVSDEPINKGEWFISTDNKVYKQDSMMYSSPALKKIIATTDTSLIRATYDGKYELPDISRLPQPSPQFIAKYVQEYNKGNLITDVMVTYDVEYFADSKGGFKSEQERDNYVFSIGASHSCWSKETLKTDNYNQITITKIKDQWSRDEVIDLLDKYRNYAWMNGCTKRGLNTWIEENL